MYGVTSIYSFLNTPHGEKLLRKMTKNEEMVLSRGPKSL